MVILPFIFKLCDFALIIFKQSCRLPQRVFAPILTIFLVDFAPVLTIFLVDFAPVLWRVRVKSQSFKNEGKITILLQNRGRNTFACVSALAPILNGDFTPYF